MFSKIIKFIAIFIGGLLLLLLLLPFAFKGEITKIAKDQINQNVNATVFFKGLSISFLRNFPNVSVDLKELSVVNKAPFKGDTLTSVGHTYINLSLKSLLSDVPKINSIKITDAFINLKVNKDSVANYDIALPSKNLKEETSKANETAPFSLAIKEYGFKNINLTYTDETSDMVATVVNFNHNGQGDLSQNKVNLNTHTNAEAIGFSMDKINYLKELQLKYDAVVAVDYEKDLSLTFKHSVAEINDLKFVFDGVFTMLQDAYDLDFVFGSEGSKFKSLLSLIPNAYTADFPKVTTSGTVDFHGKVKGKYDNNQIPTMDVVVQTKNASLKYPDLPKTIKNINIDTHLTNLTGVMDDTKLDIKQFEFKIDEDAFKASTTITQPISNPNITAKFKGKINLANLEHAYPMPALPYHLQGLVTADLATSFAMQSVEEQAYHQIKNSGSIHLNSVVVGSEYTPNPVNIKLANLVFNTQNVSLKSFDVATGKSDVQMQGMLNNLYGYLFDDKELQGNLSVQSRQFYIADFLTATDTTVVAQTSTDTAVVAEQIKIPKNIYFHTNIKANKVVYDNIEMSNFKGNALVKDQKITFSNTSTQLFKGLMSVAGFLDTKPEKTKYDFKLGIKQFDIASAFNTVDMLGKIAPIAKAFNGRFDTDLNITGVLGNDFMPDLAQLAGGAAANLQVDKIDASQNKFLSLAESKMGFLNFDKTDLKDLKAKISFKNGQANLSPVKYQYKDIPMSISGSHSFANKINYNLQMELPVKYLGNQAESLLGKLSPSDQQNITVPLNVAIGGTLTKPTVLPNMKSAVSSLTQKIVAQQKNKVKNKIEKQATKKINDLLGLGKSEKKDADQNPKPNTKEQVKSAGKKILKGLFGK